EVWPWFFFVLPPLAFALQELAERLLHAESFPFYAAFEPRFLLGLLLQIPFGLLALLVARAFLRVVERLVGALAKPRVRLRRAPGCCSRSARRSSGTSITRSTIRPPQPRPAEAARPRRPRTSRRESRPLRHGPPRTANQRPRATTRPAPRSSV